MWPQEEKCSGFKHKDAVRKEVAVDRVEIEIDIDAGFAPARYVLYLMGNVLAVQYATVISNSVAKKTNSWRQLWVSYVTHVIIAFPLQEFR